MSHAKNMNKHSSMDMMNDQKYKFVGAKQLSIAWVENNSYWRWSRIEETSSNTGLDVAELIEVCWLDVRGKFEITKLSSAKTTYEVVFVIKLEQASRWEVPLNFTLILPDGSKQERKENLEEKPKGEWIEIPIGDFVASPKRTGEIEFAIYEHGDDRWKRGLVIKGIAIRPKYQNDWFVNAKKLSIAWAENNSYWRWSKIEETSSNTAIDVAKLIEVCWLDVRGKFEITKPSPDINTYEVAFVIKLEEQASGWEVPVNLTLILPDGNKQKRRENLVGKPRGEWIEIQVGEFVASPERTGEIEFAIYEHGDDHWKKGLVIKGIAIRPKYQNDQFVVAKNLSISWVENNRYWRWSKIEETNSETAIDVAELIEVCWLDVRGKFEITKLSLAKTTYEVAFVVKLKEQASGWEVPVNVTLIQPHGNKQERKENLVGKPKGEWIEIPVGEFVASPKRTGEIEFAIYEHGDDLWKRGLVIKGIAIRPKYQNDWFVVAKNLSIAWAENNRYWRWSKIEETSCNTVIDVAELIDVCWLDVRGKFEIAKLSRARTTYEVAFVIKLEEQVSRWKVPVNVTLTLPDGNKQERKENLEGKPKGEWIEIPVGEFVASPERTGEIEFAIYEHGDHRWKKGLVIKGIAIRPKFQNDWFVVAKNLSIAWAENNHYWRWSKIEETSSYTNTGFDVAQLIEVCWLDVRGKFEITKLSRARTTYEIAFVIKLEEHASGWEVPVNVTIILPDGKKQERKENLEGKPRGDWIEILAGEFTASPGKTGEIEFAIYEHSDDRWKKGLVIKGISIRPKYQNYWFVIAKNLSITWAENNRYWRWSKIEETSSNTAVDVAELIEVCWLDVRGKFDITRLSRAITTYEVAFVIKLEEQASGWEVPVNVILILPDGNKQERKENLVGKPRGEWIEIPIGEFVASPERTGNIEFGIYEHSDDHWKKGLVIKGIAIRPKYQVLE